MSKNQSKSLVNAIFGALVFVSFPTAATLIGDQVDGCLRNPNDNPFLCENGFSNQFFIGNPAAAPVATVGVGAEFIYLNNNIVQASADFDGSSLTIAQNNGAGPFSWGFRDLDWVNAFGDPVNGMIVNVSLHDSTNLVESFSWNADSIFIRTGFNSASVTRTATFTIETVQGVPEPTTLTLLGLPLLMIGAMRLKSQS